MNQGTNDAPLVQWASQALLDVAAERRRQTEAEGWTPEHDDKHYQGEMALAGAAYAVSAAGHIHRSAQLWHLSTWEKRWFKPKSPRADLIRAAALLLAEIERLDRATDKASRHAAAAPWLE